LKIPVCMKRKPVVAELEGRKRKKGVPGRGKDFNDLE